jgi:dipeptidyl aminopeptidase/acylaminoacyl peptidase
LLYSDIALVAQRFDLERLEVFGPVLTVADRVRHRYGMAHKAEFSLSATGLLAVRGGIEDTNRLVWLDRSSGDLITTFSDGAWHSNPTLAPDGASFLATISNGRGQDSLWRFDVASGERMRVTLAGAIDLAPVWSPHGDSVLFASIRNRHMQVFERSFATGAETLALRAASKQVPESWSRDGATSRSRR